MTASSGGRESWCDTRRRAWAPITMAAVTDRLARRPQQPPRTSPAPGRLLFDPLRAGHDERLRTARRPPTPTGVEPSTGRGSDLRRRPPRARGSCPPRGSSDACGRRAGDGEDQAGGQDEHSREETKTAPASSPLTSTSAALSGIRTASSATAPATSPILIEAKMLPGLLAGDV